MGIEYTSISAGGVDFPVSLSARSLTDRMVVFLPGAFDLKNSKPKFQRQTYFSKLDCTCLSVFDPTLFLSEELKIGWFQGQGGKFYAPLLGRAIKQFAADVGVETQNILLFGTSAAGIPAFFAAKELPGSTVYVGNPQTDIMKYYPRLRDEMLNVCYGGVVSAEVKPNLSILGSHFDGKLVYSQNKADMFHYKNHYLPFRAASAFDQSCVQYVEFENPEIGHNPPASDIEISIIKALIHGGNIEPILGAS